MRSFTKAVLGAIALAGAAVAVSAPAKAAVGVYLGVGPDPYYDYGGYYDSYDPYYNDGYYDGYAGYDPYCDYYTPPWGYPPDYCRYQLWYEPIFFGGSWYNGPIYYRTYGGFNWFWLNGGWHRDEWRGGRLGPLRPESSSRGRRGP